MVYRIVILGGGYGGLNAALELEGRLSRSRARDWEILLIDRCSYHQHIILLHEVAANSISPEDAIVPFARLLKGKRITFMQGKVSEIDLRQRRVTFDGRQIPYSYLVIALGSETEFFGIPGLQENSLPLKSLEDATRLHAQIRRMFTLSRTASAEERRAMLTFVVGGGGFTGTELAGELADWLPELARANEIPASEVRLLVVESGNHLVSGFGRRPPKIAARILREKDVGLHLGVRVVKAESGAVQLSTGETIATRTLVWTGGVKAPPQLAEWGLQTGSRGRAVIDGYLESVSHPGVYILGDSSLVIDPSNKRPVPPSAQLALQQADCVADNLAADLGYGRRRRFEFSLTGEVISVGRREAIATFGPIVFDGYQARLLKEAIALRYYYRIGGPALALEKLPGAWRASGIGPGILLPRR